MAMQIFNLAWAYELQTRIEGFCDLRSARQSRVFEDKRTALGRFHIDVSIHQRDIVPDIGKSPNVRLARCTRLENDELGANVPKRYEL